MINFLIPKKIRRTINRIKIFWNRMQLRKETFQDARGHFHDPFSWDVKAMWDMTPKEREEYKEDMTKRRIKAYEEDPDLLLLESRESNSVGV